MEINTYHCFQRATLPTQMSAADFGRWNVMLTLMWGVGPMGLHGIQWLHDETCVYHLPNLLRLHLGRCSCRPDAVLVLHAGRPCERRIEIVRDGVALPVQPLNMGGLHVGS